jgi:hypothetical protein
MVREAMHSLGDVNYKITHYLFTHIQAYYGDHWLFTNIERKATLDIEIFQ